MTMPIDPSAADARPEEGALALAPSPVFAAPVARPSDTSDEPPISDEAAASAVTQDAGVEPSLRFFPPERVVTSQASSSAGPINLPLENAAAPALSPAERALANARGGYFVVDEDMDGWVLIGANGRPVLRRDGSRVGFKFRDLQRLAPHYRALAETQDAADLNYGGLADPDTGNDDRWQRRLDSKRAALINTVQQLAHVYMRPAEYGSTLEPEEALRRAVVTATGDPVYFDQPFINAWIPRDFNLNDAQFVAMAMLRETVGNEGVPVDELSDREQSGFELTVTDALFIIGSTFPTDPTRKRWEKYWGEEWPRDKNGRYLTVSHIVPRLGRNLEDPWNIFPEDRDTHSAYHKDSGDYSLWARLRNAGGLPVEAEAIRIPEPDEETKQKFRESIRNNDYSWATKKREEVSAAFRNIGELYLSNQKTELREEPLREAEARKEGEPKPELNSDSDSGGDRKASGSGDQPNKRRGKRG